MRVKKELKNIDPSKFDFADDTAIFTNESLCSYYKMLWNGCKKLWEKKLIDTYFTLNRNIWYRIRENENVHTVTHTTDFKNNFPDIDINGLYFYNLIFGFWIACVWKVLDIFGIVNFIFLRFCFWENALHMLLYLPWSEFFVSLPDWILLLTFQCYHLIKKLIFCWIIEPYL